MRFTCSHYEFGVMTVSILKKYLPSKYGIYDVALMHDGFTVKGEYDVGTGVIWSLPINACVSGDGKHIGLEFLAPRLNSSVLSLFVSGDKMMSKILAGLKAMSDKVSGVELKANVLWVDVDFFAKKLGWYSLVSSLNVLMERDRFVFESGEA